MMRLSLFISLCLTCAAIITSTATSAAPSSTPPELEPETYAQIQGMYNECVTEAHDKTYNCDCVAIRFQDYKKQFFNRLDSIDASEAEQQFEWQRSAYMIKRQAYNSCLNEDKFTLDTYSQCINRSLTIRSDYREYCGCFAMKYAAIYRARGNRPGANNADLMTEAMQSCK